MDPIRPEEHFARELEQLMRAHNQLLGGMNAGLKQALKQTSAKIRNSKYLSVCKPYLKTFRSASYEMKTQDREKIIEMAQARTVDLLNAIAFNDIFDKLGDLQKDNLFLRLSMLATYLSMVHIANSGTFVPLMNIALNDAQVIAEKQRESGLTGTIGHIISEPKYMTEMQALLLNAPRNKQTQFDLLDLIAGFGVASKEKIESSRNKIEQQQQEMESKGAGPEENVTIHVGQEPEPMNAMDDIATRMLANRGKTSDTVEQLFRNEQQNDEDFKKMFGGAAKIGDMLADMLVENATRAQQTQEEVKNIMDVLATPGDQKIKIFQTAMDLLTGANPNPADAMSSLVNMIGGGGGGGGGDDGDDGAPADSSLLQHLPQTIQPVILPSLSSFEDCEAA